MHCVPLASAVFLQTPALQLSVVQMLLSLHWLAEVQQLEIGVLTQALLTQVSAVQGLLSPHWLAEVQQPEIAVLEQLPPEQLSVVQALLSLQSPAVEQPAAPKPWGLWQFEQVA